MKYLILISLFIFSGCTNKVQHQQKEENVLTLPLLDTHDSPPDTSCEEDSTHYSFNIMSRNVANIMGVGEKVEYVVVIDNKYTEHELNCIANDIKKTDKDSIKYVFVSFYLNKMSLNGPNYAISKKTPSENSTEINFIELVKDEPSSTAPYANSEIIGKWAMPGGAITTIYKMKSSYYMIDEYSPNNYGDPEKLIFYTINNAMAFKYVDDTGETFVIMKDGLYGYMNGDLSCVFSNVH